MNDMYEIVKNEYKKERTPYSSQYSTLSSSLSLYMGNDNPGQAYNKVFGASLPKRFVEKDIR